MPEAIANPPQLWPWLQVFNTAFNDLKFDRPNLDMPIPWAVRQHWAEVHGLDYQAQALLHTHVQAMDTEFMKWLRKKAKQGRKRGPDKDAESLEKTP